MTIIPLPKTSTPDAPAGPTGPGALEHRAAKFGIDGLIKLACALVVADRGLALQVEAAIAGWPDFENVNEEDLRPALERLAILAATQAAHLRLPTTEATS